MDYDQVSRFGLYISKDYSRDIFGLLLKYADISASEAASRLDLHIKTVQDFLEAMAACNILERKQVSDKKRPYYRYSLSNSSLNIVLDLRQLLEKNNNGDKLSACRIREKQNSGAHFTTARYDSLFSSISIPHGNGRLRTERKINLTEKQGKFLYKLPFPGAGAKTVKDLMLESSLDNKDLPEIQDILELLIEQDIIEIIH
ncbi:MAG: hypothetical protein V2I37_03985 [Marinilabiliaceae bacterium]|jgi:predicted transcriptional regulator|nr:hypothetical protein [Marinilabiliaceae bacterium]